MTPTTTKLLTAEEFARLPEPEDGSRQELVRGVVITMPPPGFNHGKSQFKFAVLLAKYLETHPIGHAVIETGARTATGPDAGRGPDVGFGKYQRLPAGVKGEV